MLSKAEKKSQRNAYGVKLVELGGRYKELVVLEADLSKSTMGTKFESAYPERFFEMGIAEADMASAAAGLAIRGKIPFMGSFAVFSSGRCYDQIRTSVCIPALNVKICGSSAGLSDYGDGSTHQSIDDIAIMRVLPNMQVFVPADASETERIMEYMAANKGPMYLRVNRNDLPELTTEEFVPGKVYVMREGSDAAVFAQGVMLSLAIEAAEELEKEGVSVMVVNVPSVKPLDADAVAQLCASVRGVVTAEEHSIYGGMGSAIAEAVSERLAVKIKRVGVEDSFGTSGENYDVLLKKYGLTAEHIAESVRAVLA